jgi:hypothetical protein
MAQGFLESTPIEFKDFSGGLTDNFLQGDVTRYEKADNFLLSNDHKLEERYGSKIYDPTAYQLNTSGLRVTSLFLDQNETRLFGQSGRNLYTQSPDDRYGTSWSVIAGPTGNEAVCGGGIYSQLSTGEFQRQIFYTSDFGTLPGKLFRDQTDTWKAVSAGMPRMVWVPRYVDDYSLLLACIQLANDLRSSMISHMEDQAGILTGTSTSYQHKYLDKYSLSYLKSETFTGTDPEYPGPSPAPTPAPAATDEDTLYTLCEALALAYEHHRKDLTGDTPNTSIGSRYYHQDIYLFPPNASATGSPVFGTYAFGGTSGTSPLGLGINARLANSGAVDTATRAAIFLDDLAQKWYWHQLSPYSHHTSNDLTMMSKYLIDSTNANVKIAPLYTSSTQLQVTPNYTEFMALAKWAKDAWTRHTQLTGIGASSASDHGQADFYATIPFDAVDYDSAALMLFWVRWLYGQVHMADANYAAYKQITFTTTAASKNLTVVTLTSSGAAITLPVDSWIATASKAWGVGVSQVRMNRVVSSAAGTATMLYAANANGAGVEGVYGSGWFHSGYRGGAVTGSEIAATSAAAAEFLTSPGDVPTDLSGWIDAATEFLIAFATHMLNGWDHVPSNPTSHIASVLIKNYLTGLSTISGNPFFVPEIANYSWAALYRYKYTVEKNGLIYIDEGAPVFSDAMPVLKGYPVGTTVTSFNSTYFDNAVIAQENEVATIEDIPQLENTLLTNYDTTVSVVPIPESPLATGYYQNLTIELYRTADTGTTFYYLDSIENIDPGTITPELVTYDDCDQRGVPKASWRGRSRLSARPCTRQAGWSLTTSPRCASTCMSSTTSCTTERSLTRGSSSPSVFAKAIQRQPGSAPATFFDDLEDELVGLTSTRTNLTRHVQELPVLGSRDRLRAQAKAQSSTRSSLLRWATSTPDRSYQTEVGVFFAGTDGFYYTDGFQLIKVSLELDKTYASLTKSDNQKQRIYGAYDKNTRRIYWAMQSQATAQDNDVFFVYYLNYGVKPSGVFTKVFTNDSWKPASVAFYKGNLIVGDSRGYLFKTDVLDEVRSGRGHKRCALPMGRDRDPVEVSLVRTRHGCRTQTQVDHERARERRERRQRRHSDQFDQRHGKAPERSCLDTSPCTHPVQAQPALGRSNDRLGRP